MIQAMNPMSLGNSMQRYYTGPSGTFPSNTNSTSSSSNPNVLSNSMLDMSQSANGSSSLYNSAAYMNNSEEKIKQNRQNPMSILTNQAHARSGHNMSGTHLHSPNHQQLINPTFSPAVIAAAATALQAMGVNPTTHPQYAQIIQNQFQNPAQQFSQIHHYQTSQFPQNLSNTNGENGFVKKEPNMPVVVPTPPPTINSQLSNSSQQSENSNSTSTSSSSSSSTAPQTVNPTSVTPQPSAASYIPQVEAISPTPEDQKENSNIASLKQKINEDLEKVDRDIANTQYQLESLEKKKVCNNLD